MTICLLLIRSSVALVQKNVLVKKKIVPNVLVRRNIAVVLDANVTPKNVQIGNHKCSDYDVIKR